MKFPFSMSVEHCRAGIVQLCKKGASRFRVALQRKVNPNKNDSKINSVYFRVDIGYLMLLVHNKRAKGWFIPHSLLMFDIFFLVN